jgi:hypothetical protein
VHALCSAVAGEAAAERSQAQQQLQRQPVTQLSVTGVSLAVMSRRHAHAAVSDAAASIPAASAAQGPAPGVSSSSMPSGQANARAASSTPSAVATDLAAALAAEGWQECHVLLRQWQCTIALCAAAKAVRGGSGAAGKAAQQSYAGSVQDQAPPAIILQYQTAGVSEVGQTVLTLKGQTAVIGCLMPIALEVMSWPAQLGCIVAWRACMHLPVVTKPHHLWV